MAIGFAHLLAMPNKLAMSREDCFTAQRVYDGWALLGIVIFPALFSTIALTVMEWNTTRFRLTPAAARA